MQIAQPAPQLTLELYCRVVVQVLRWCINFKLPGVKGFLVAVVSTKEGKLSYPFPPEVTDYLI